MGLLTTHALNTMAGKPAVGLRIELSIREGEVWRRLKTVRTNAQGRTDAPLLDASEIKDGQYELLFHVAEYFAALGVVQAGAFLEEVPIRFRIADRSEHYHVPLLMTPWSYSSYRGS